MPRMEILITTLLPFFLVDPLNSSLELPHLPGATAYLLRGQWPFLAPFSLELFVPTLFVPSWAHTFQASLPASGNCLPHPKTSSHPWGFCHIRTLPQVDFLLIPPCLLWLHCYLSLSCLTPPCEVLFLSWPFFLFSLDSFPFSDSEIFLKLCCLSENSLASVQFNGQRRHTWVPSSHRS